MSAQEDAGKGICILSFDNGGTGCYAQLTIVKEYMGRLANDLGVSEDDLCPADYFDLIGGVGFGGLLALLLGHLRMTANEADEALLAIALAIFPEGSKGTGDPDTNLKNLREAIEDMLQARHISLNSKMYDQSLPPTRCKVVLFAATAVNLNHPQAFRTYPSRGSTLNPTIVEAVCATMATPSYFSPVKVGPRLRQQTFAGGAFGAQNPTRTLLNEACAVFGNSSRVAQIISIGCGAPQVVSTKSAVGEIHTGHPLKEMALDCEAVAEELSTRLFNVDAYLRLNADKGMEDMTMEDWTILGDVESHTRIYLEAVAVTEALEASLRRLVQRIGTLPLGQLTHSTSIKAVAKKAPSVSPHYVLRKEYQTMVHHLTALASLQQRIFPITGMGGCGKTQMVSYFLQEHPNLYKHTVFVDASSSATIKTDLQAWARTLGDGHERDVWEDALRILTSAPAEEQWALILDNADDPALNLGPFLPKSNYVTVIITSRNRHLGNLSTTRHIEMGEMETEEALATLLKSARRQLPISIEESESAHTLMKELGCLAVALVQAGTYCHQMSPQLRGVVHPYTFTQYLSIFYSHRAELMKSAEPSSLDNYQRGAYTTLDLSYTALPPPAREFLHLISFFRHTDIPLVAVASAANYGFKDRFTLLPRPAEHHLVIAKLDKLLRVNGQWSELQVHEIIRTLCSFSLLAITSTDSVFLQLHPLIQAWSRDMNTSDSRHYRAMYLQLVAACSQRDAVLLNRLLIPHVLETLNQIATQNFHVNDLVAIGVILRSQGYFQRAIGLFEAALEVMEKSLEKNDKGKFIVMAWLGRAYAKDGKWDKAEKLQMQVLEQDRKILGMEHSDTFSATSHLASTFRSQGKWNIAEKLEVEVLEQSRKILGIEHPDTISATAHLAATYYQQGKWGDAEKLQVDVLEQSGKVLGMEHPDTISAAAHLAVTYYRQGKWGEAEKLQAEVLERRRNIFGKEHPSTITAAMNLASTYQKQGKWDESEKLQVEVLEKSRKVLGMEHWDTFSAMARLAATYLQQGKWDDAEKLQVEVLEQCSRILGTEHPETISAATNLASTYGKQGKWEEVALLTPAVQLGSKV